MKTMTEKLYGDRDPRKQGKFYTDHLMAMTEEGLHDKSDIAMELAYRDIELHRLKEVLRIERDATIVWQKAFKQIADIALMKIPLG